MEMISLYLTASSFSLLPDQHIPSTLTNSGTSSRSYSVCKCCILHQPHNRGDYLRSGAGGKEVILSAPCPSKRSHQRYERHLGGCPALATPQTRDAPQTPVSQGKREMLGERPGQLSHLPPPSAGTAPPRQRRACILPCRGRAAGRSCRPIIRHIFF